MSDLLQMAAEHFAGRDLPHRAIAQPRAIEVTHSWLNIPFKSYAQSQEGDQIFVYYSLCPERVPADRRSAVMDYITRVNFNLLVGNFELDAEDGEVRCRTSIELGGGTMTRELLGAMVNANHQAMITYLQPLVAVLRGEQSAEDAFLDATTL